MQPDRSNVPGVDLYSKCILTSIALLLAILAFRPITHPPVAEAQSDYSYVYIEPRTTALRNPDGSQQLQGKVVVDLRNGNIWGFPTYSSLPYPTSNVMRAEPPVSSPMYLGKFDFSKMNTR
jgi:hypothetical protein